MTEKRAGSLSLTLALSRDEVKSLVLRLELGVIQLVSDILMTRNNRVIRAKGVDRPVVMIAPHRRIMTGLAIQRRDQLEGFLRQVSVFDSLDEDDLARQAPVCLHC